jgi:hypothetical protein
MTAPIQYGTELVFGVKPEWRDMPVAGLSEGATARVEFRHRQPALCHVTQGEYTEVWYLTFADGRQAFRLFQRHP